MRRGKSKQNIPGQGSLFDSSNKKLDSSSTNQTLCESNTQRNEIVLYPSNWLYNASVIGFLKVVAKGEGEYYVEKEILQDDRSVKLYLEIFKNTENIGNKSIPKSIKYLAEFLIEDEIERIKKEVEKIKKLKEKRQEQRQEQTDENKKKKGKKKEVNEKTAFEKFLENLGLDSNKIINNPENLSDEEKLACKFYFTGNILFSSDMPYQNLVQLNEWRNLEFSELISSMFIRNTTNLKCGLCGENIQEINTNSKLELRLTTFQHPHFPSLGPSINKFPNALWNLNNSLKICFLCSYLLIHNHLAFISSEGNSQIFINAPSFKLMWYLNRFAERVISEGGKDLGKILGISLIDLSQRVRATIGAWSLMNIEMVIRKKGKDKDTIDYYSLPYEIASILLDKEIASMIKQTDEPKVLEKILEGNFDYLLDLNYRIMRCLNNWKEKCDDAYISESELKNRGDKEKLEYLTTLLPLLYVKISQRSIAEGRVL
ncbi:MAG: hypothetical protein KNN14_07925 [Aquificota bacterium]|nr:MAG: hypothetical protein KNN14_07925 [Aquificota bacterium]